jgi:hypothetical protein
MFKIINRPEFTHEVTVTMPVDGGFEDFSFRARFRLLPTSDVEGMKVDSVDGMKAFLKKVIVDLLDLVDEQDKPLTFNAKLLDQVLDLQPSRIALMQTYFAAVSKGRAGN